MAVVGGRVGRSGSPRATQYGVASLRRHFGAGGLDAEQVLFAPARAQSLLLGLVRLSNPGAEALGVEYSERWELPVVGAHARPGQGACEVDTPAGPRALADVSLAVRTAPLDPPLATGLALAVRLLVPPGATRVFSFAYAAPSPDDPAPGVLARAWRGEVADEFARTLAFWRALAPPADASGSPVVAYRRNVSEAGDAPAGPA